mgnify:FL=1
MDNYDIIIYSDNINNRKKYVFSHIFNNYFSINPLITQNIEEFKISNLPKICYANQPINNVFYIKPQGLLDEFNKIQEKNLEVEYIDNIPTIFNTNNECNLGFDVFSAVFYLLSRYEEYTNKNFDRHGRFDESFSFFVKNNLHSEPLVDIWINYLGTKLSTIYPSLIKNESTFQYHPTIDIDDFYEIKGKSIAYTWLRLFKKLLFGKIKELKFFINVITNKKDDPYDSYDFLHFNLKNHFPTPVFFFHVGGKKSSYDNSNNYWSLSVKNKILSFLQHYQCGLHVSYNSNNNADRIKKKNLNLKK